jgi:hypothetical protein
LFLVCFLVTTLAWSQEEPDDSRRPADESCRDPGKNEQGDKEGLALPWRLVAVGTFTLGNP